MKWALSFFKNLLQAIKDRIRMKRLSVVLWVTVFALFSLLIILMSILIGNRSQSLLNEQYNAACRDSLNQIEVAFDVALGNVLDLTLQYYDDIQLEQAIEREELSFREIDYLLQRLNALMYSNRFVDSVALLMEKSGYVIASGQGAYWIRDYEDERFFDWYYENQNRLQIEGTYPLREYARVKQYDDKMAVYVRLPIKNRGRENRAALAIYLDHDYWTSNLFRPIEQHDTGIFVYDAQGKIVMSNRPGWLYRNIADLHLPNEDGGFISIDEKNMLIFSNPIRRTGWQLVGLFPYERIYAPISSMYYFIAGLCICLMIIGIVACRICINRIMHPINETIDLIEKNFDEPNPDLNRAFVKLLELRDELSAKLDRVQSTARDKAILDILRNKLAPEKRRQLIERFELSSFDAPNMFLMLLSLDEDDITDADLIEIILLDEIEKEMRLLGIRVICVCINPYDMAVVIDSNNISDVKIGVERVKEVIKAKKIASPRIVLYDQQINAENLYRAFSGAYDLLNLYKSFYTEDIIYFSREISLPEDHISGLLLQKVNNALKNGNRDHILSIIGNYAAYIFGQDNPLFRKQQLYKLDSILSENSVKVQNTLVSSESATSLYEEVAHAIADLPAKEIRKNDERKQKITSQIMDYIYDNYANDISLSDVCDHLSVSASYVNQTLKQSTGKTFLRLLNEHRISVACTMLENKDISIKDVSVKVGFSNPAYFIKVFKEIVGVTPGKLRDIPQ